jgi:hypothetical protein
MPSFHLDAKMVSMEVWYFGGPLDSNSNINIYFKVVVVQIQVLERIPQPGRDSSHPGAGRKVPHPKDESGIRGM